MVYYADDSDSHFIRIQPTLNRTIRIRECNYSILKSLDPESQLSAEDVGHNTYKIGLGELFFDLVFVGVFRSYEVFFEAATPHNTTIELYFLQFFFLWEFWKAQTNYLTLFGNHDLYQLGYQFVIGFLIVFTCNHIELGIVQPNHDIIAMHDMTITTILMMALNFVFLAIYARIYYGLSVMTKNADKIIEEKYIHSSLTSFNQTDQLSEFLSTQSIKPLARSISKITDPSEADPSFSNLSYVNQHENQVLMTNISPKQLEEEEEEEDENEEEEDVKLIPNDQKSFVIEDFTQEEFQKRHETLSIPVRNEIIHFGIQIFFWLIVCILAQIEFTKTENKVILLKIIYWFMGLGILCLRFIFMYFSPKIHNFYPQIEHFAERYQTIILIAITESVAALFSTPHITKQLDKLQYYTCMSFAFILMFSIKVFHFDIHYGARSHFLRQGPIQRFLYSNMCCFQALGIILFALGISGLNKNIVCLFPWTKSVTIKHEEIFFSENEIEIASFGLGLFLFCSMIMDIFGRISTHQSHKNFKGSNIDDNVHLILEIGNGLLLKWSIWWMIQTCYFFCIVVLTFSVPFIPFVLERPVLTLSLLTFPLAIFNIATVVVSNLYKDVLLIDITESYHLTSSIFYERDSTTSSASIIKQMV